MVLSNRIAALTLAAALAGVSAAAQAEPVPAAAAATPDTSHPAQVRATRAYEFVSAVNGRPYSVRVALPLGPPPPGGYPVLYVTDAEGYFNTFTDAARLRAALAGELEPAMIVGIGYPDTEALPMILGRRYSDLTPTDLSPAERDRRLGPFSKLPIGLGEAESFLRIIQTEIEPQVERMATVNPARRMLFGHSLGGLFVLHVLFDHPDAFSTYLALSPSIWWNDRVVLADEAGFVAKVRAGTVAPRVFIGVGGREQGDAPMPRGPLPAGITLDDIRNSYQHDAQVDNSRGLAQRLQAIKGAPGYKVTFELFPGQTHNAVPWAAINPILEFALPPHD